MHYKTLIKLNAGELFVKRLPINTSRLFGRTLQGPRSFQILDSARRNFSDRAFHIAYGNDDSIERLWRSVGHLHLFTQDYCYGSYLLSIFKEE